VAPETIERSLYPAATKRCVNAHLTAANMLRSLGPPCGHQHVGEFSKAGLELAACRNTMKSQNVTLGDLCRDSSAPIKAVRMAELQSQALFAP
jgi:intracellular sulfur oxidation DsrE/DsrF family protein